MSETLTQRIMHYVVERKKVLQLDPESIHALHSEPDPRHAELRVSDLTGIVAALIAETARADREAAARQEAERERDESESWVKFHKETKEASYLATLDLVRQRRAWEAERDRLRADLDATREALVSAVNAIDVAASVLGVHVVADELRKASRRGMAAILQGAAPVSSDPLNRSQTTTTATSEAPR